MTVIAWDGRTLAADKRCSYGNSVRTVTKIRRLADGRLAGIAGSGAAGEAVIAWLNAGSGPHYYPEIQKSDDHASVLVIERDGSVLEYSKTAHPERYEDKFIAIGSGRDFAVAAMHCGRTAVEAVELACQLDTGCGNGIDVLRFE